MTDWIIGIPPLVTPMKTSNVCQGPTLLDLTASALAQNHTLDNYSGFVEDSGEGRWTVNAAIDEAVPAEVLTAALFARFRSRKDHTFAEKILSAMRAGFGGHREPTPSPGQPKA